MPKISDEDGKLRDPTGLERMSTRYPWSLRKGQAQAAADSMKQRGVRPDGQSNTPHVLALWDAIGIAHELNGYRNDVAGWIKKYGDERELEIDAINSYDGLAAAMATRAGQEQRLAQDERLANAANWHVPQEMAERRAIAATLPEPQRSQQLQICDTLDDWAKRDVPALGFEGRLNAANALPEPRRTQEMNAVKADVDRFTRSRSSNYQRRIRGKPRHLRRAGRAAPGAQQLLG